MAIRTIKLGCLMTWQERAEKKLTVEPCLTIDSSGEVSISVYGENQVHSALFFVKSDTTAHAGLCVDIFSRVERVMSDVWESVSYVTVFVPETGGFKNVAVCTSGFESGWQRTVWTLDADETTKEAYKAWQRGLEFKNELAALEARENATLHQRRTVEKGKTVKVVSGRKVAKGTVGKVFWLESTSYAGRSVTKLGIGLPSVDGTYRMVSRSGRNGQTYESYADVAWTYASNVRVINPETGREI